jgi:hypothetical protein
MEVDRHRARWNLEQTTEPDPGAKAVDPAIRYKDL